MAFVLKVKSLGSKPQNWRKKGLFWAIFRSILGENMAFFAKSRRKLRTKNFEAHFHRKLRTLEKCSNVKKLRTTEPQPIFTGSYKKKKCIFIMWYSISGKESWTHFRFNISCALAVTVRSHQKNVIVNSFSNIKIGCLQKTKN